MDIQENVYRIKQIMTEGKDAYVERARFDQEYEEEYPRWQKIMIRFLEMEINSYDENDNIIILFKIK